MTTDTNTEVVEQTTEATEEVVVEETPLSFATTQLAAWSGLSKRLFRQDERLLRFLEDAEGNQATEKEIVTAIPNLSTWSFRRLATGVHHKKTEGPALIERVSVDGSKGWKLTEVAIEAKPEAPAKPAKPAPKASSSK